MILDALSYFDKSQYNLSVIVAHHTALEIYLEAYLRDILGKKYEGQELEFKLEKLWEGEKLHKKVRRIFYGNVDEGQLLQHEDSYKRFDSSRNLRKLAVHKNSKLTEKDTLDAIQYIFSFVGYLNENKQTLTSNILLNY